MSRDPLVKPELLQGTLDLLVLRILADETLHGYALAQRLHLLSEGRLAVPQGSLYPSLRRLENQVLIRGEWTTTTTGREAKVYRLTPAGRRRLRAELKAWRQVSSAVNLVIRTA